MCNLAQVVVKRSPTLGTLVSTKTKCLKLIFIMKITLVPVAFLMALSIVSHCTMAYHHHHYHEQPFFIQEGQVALNHSPELCLKLTYI